MLIQGLGDKLEGMAEEIKGKILRKPEVVEHGRERRTGELARKERERASRLHLASRYLYTDGIDLML